MVRFGVAGYPPAFKKSVYGRDRIKILNWLSELGLDAFEIQMTYGPKMRPDSCIDYRRIADHLNIALSVHASYYIVFTSDDNNKLQRSRETLKRTFDLCSILGANIIVLHPGPLYKLDPTNILERFIENLSSCMNEIGSTEIGLFVETAGKLGQLGSVDEILHICKNINGVHPCLDFGHIHARTLGSLFNDKSVDTLFDFLKLHGFVGKKKRIHFHYTPIDFGPNGEITHKAINDKYRINEQLSLPMMERNKYRSLDGLFYPRISSIVKGIKSNDINCNIISETHDSQEEGALALKEAYKGILI